MPHLNIPVANPVVVLREEFDDWAVLYNPDTAQAMGTNPVGVAIWKLIDGKRDVASIAAELKSRFSDVPEESVDADTRSFIEELSAKGFVGYELPAAE
jgi:SynChlorMet cassette protein ScmD